MQCGLLKRAVSIGEKVIIEGLQKVRPGVEVRGIEKHVDPLVGTISDIDDKSIDSSKVTKPTISPSATTDK